MPNNIFLNRLQIITDNGEIAFDEPFHKGVNIIRGDNSSGKSTITHFIFYVLGGAFKDFVPSEEKKELKKLKRSMIKNPEDVYNLPNNKIMKFNKLK